MTSKNQKKSNRIYAQVYFDHLSLVRIFDSNDEWVADLSLNDDTTLESADRSLKRMHLKRTTKWFTRECGAEATIAFIK